MTDESIEADTDCEFFNRAIAMLYHAFDPERTDVGFATAPEESPEGWKRWFFTADKGGDAENEGEPLAAGHISVSCTGPEIVIVTTRPFKTVTCGVVVLDS